MTLPTATAPKSTVAPRLAMGEPAGDSTAIRGMNGIATSAIL
jgi:hypothetical protein